MRVGSEQNQKTYGFYMCQYIFVQYVAANFTKICVSISILPKTFCDEILGKKDRFPRTSVQVSTVYPCLFFPRQIREYDCQFN